MLVNGCAISTRLWLGTVKGAKIGCSVVKSSLPSYLVIWLASFVSTRSLKRELAVCVLLHASSLTFITVAVMNISALLNPDHDRRQSNLSLRRRGASPTRRASTSPIDEGDSVTPTPKSMSREAKDAPKFEKGRPSGEVRYPPYHPVSDSIVQEMKRYSIFPETSIINSFPRHIPYNSDKKRFTARTGREGFEGTWRDTIRPGSRADLCSVPVYISLQGEAR